MVRTLITPNLFYSESKTKTPKFDYVIAEEPFLTANIRSKYSEIEELVQFCRKCRKYIRLAQRRQIINEIDTTCLHLVQKYLFIAERILFDEQNTYKVIKHAEYPTVDVETTVCGFRIVGWGKLLAHKKYKSIPTLAVDKQKRMDAIEKEVSRALDSLSDGYY